MAPLRSPLHLCRSQSLFKPLRGSQMVLGLGVSDWCETRLLSLPPLLLKLLSRGSGMVLATWVSSISFCTNLLPLSSLLVLGGAGSLETPVGGQLSPGCEKV